MRRWLVVLLPSALAVALCASLSLEAPKVAQLTLLSSETITSVSPLQYASYLRPKGPEMVRLGR